MSHALVWPGARQEFGLLLMLALRLQTWNCAVQAVQSKLCTRCSSDLLHLDTWAWQIGFKSYLDVHEHMQLLLALVKSYLYHLSMRSDNDAAKYTYR